MRQTVKMYADTTVSMTQLSMVYACGFSFGKQANWLSLVAVKYPGYALVL